MPLFQPPSRHRHRRRGAGHRRGGHGPAGTAAPRQQRGLADRPGGGIPRLRQLRTTPVAQLDGLPGTGPAARRLFRRAHPADHDQQLYRVRLRRCPAGLVRTSPGGVGGVFHPDAAGGRRPGAVRPAVKANARPGPRQRRQAGLFHRYPAAYSRILSPPGLPRVQPVFCRHAGCGGNLRTVFQRLHAQRPGLHLLGVYRQYRRIDSHPVLHPVHLGAHL